MHWHWTVGRAILVLALALPGAASAAIEYKDGVATFTSATIVTIQFEAVFTGSDAQKVRDTADADQDGLVNATEVTALRIGLRQQFEHVGSSRLDGRQAADVEARADTIGVEGPAASMRSLTLLGERTLVFDIESGPRHVYQNPWGEYPQRGPDTKMTFRAPPGFVIESSSGFSPALTPTDGATLLVVPATGAHAAQEVVFATPDAPPTTSKAAPLGAGPIGGVLVCLALLSRKMRLPSYG